MTTRNGKRAPVRQGRGRARSSRLGPRPAASRVAIPGGAAPGGDSLQRIAGDVVACELCPRLRRYCQEIASSKRRAYRDWTYWGRPVPGFGDPRARLWILGLAPAAHGANRTGRMFTGDSSGDWLYCALHAGGFATLPTSVHRDDGQELHDAYVSAAARCAPPNNRPSPAELDRCARYLDRELHALPAVRVVLALGQIAFAAALRLLERNAYELPRPRPRFAHGACYSVRRPAGGAEGGPLVLLASYHPSRQNTQTGRLTRPMLDGVVATARRFLAGDPA